MKFFATSRISENILRTPEGFLICIGVPIARTGDMEYGRGETPLVPGPNGTVLITRDEKEVFRPETLASFEGKAVTIGHPTNFVSPDNWNELANGILQNVHRGKGDQSDSMMGDLLITSRLGINLVLNGLREVSLGYDAEYFQTGPGRGYQTNIVGNHCALVQEARAGSAYAINDHKGKGSEMTPQEKIKAIFEKAQADAMLLIEPQVTPKKAAATTDAGEGTSMNVSYDQVMEKVTDLVKGMMPGKPADATTPATENQPAKPVAADADVNSGLEERMKKLEAAVSAILEKMAPTGDEDGDDEEEVTDEDGDEDESEDAGGCVGSEDDGDYDGGDKVGDSASRVEILAPGMNPEAKNVKKKAILAAYATADGKAAIHTLTGGKKPDLKDEKVVDMIFIGASEALKVKRGEQLAGSRTVDFRTLSPKKGAMTAEQINKANAERYKVSNTI
jgi:uncharacterized protein